MLKHLLRAAGFALIGGSLVGCGSSQETRKEVHRFSDCVVTQLDRGAGAWDAWQTEIRLRCSDRPESVILSGRRLREVRFRSTAQRLVIEYGSGDITGYRNHYPRGGKDQIEVDLVRRR